MNSSYYYKYWENIHLGVELKKYTTSLLFVSWPLGRPLWGVPTGPKVFLDFTWRVWAAALRPDPLLKKGLVPYLSGGGMENK